MAVNRGRGRASSNGDTIAAISTPPGTAGIAVIRISGPDAIPIGDRVCLLRGGRRVATLRSWSAALATVVEPESGEPVDEAIVLVMKAPRSYTGEDTVEIQCHGGRLVAEKVLSVVLGAGARLAEPGEFTRRAFLSGRITLDEAEAVLDVVMASTEASLRQATRRLKGELGARIERWEREVVNLLSEVQASLDFPDEASFFREELAGRLNALSCEIGDLLRRAPLGLALSQGVDVCLVGRPNVGKSSLFNALLGRDRAIVTEIPGTTRDILRETAEWYGIPVTLLDTAGLRHTEEIVEAIGVERAASAASESEVILYVIDDSAGITDEDLNWIEKWRDRRLLVIANKVDLGVGRASRETLERLVPGSWVRASSATGEGLEEIKRRVAGMFDSETALQAVVPGSARQVDCLRRATLALDQAVSHLEAGWTDDVIAMFLEEAAQAFSELTGKNVTEEMLDAIFARFCVGK